jgi:hypothetical protein
LTKSAPDIHRKLPKLAAEGGNSLDQLVQVATTIFYNKDLEKERKRDKCQEMLIKATSVTPLGTGLKTHTYFLYREEGYFRR